MPWEYWMPHGHCYFWDSWVLLMNVFGDLTTWLAYMLIPLGLESWLRRQKRAIISTKAKLLIRGFETFIFSCGITHLIDVWVVWSPHYFFQGLQRVETGIVSLAVAYLMFTKRFRDAKLRTYKLDERTHATDIELPPERV